MLVAVLLATGALAASPAHAVVRSDFNGDGRSDLAVGAPGEAPGSGPGAGQVTVLYGGSGARLNGAPSQAFNQDTDGVPDAGEAHDRFGAEMATGDFDGDGHADLAIAAPGEGVRDRAHAGQVTVLRGAAGTGLHAAGAQAFTQEVAQPGGPAAGAGFGEALASGDFNGDGRADLAVGAPSGGTAGAGQVTVLYGTLGGLAPAGARTFSGARAGQLFGAALAVGDFDGDATSDLAVGAPGAGIVAVLAGSAAGLGGVVWAIGHDAASLAGPTGGAFGGALAAADFDRDGADDLAVGAPGAAVAGHAAAGRVAVIRGAPGRGLDRAAVQTFDYAPAGSTHIGDLFGAALATGDFNRDGTAELAVGAPGATVAAARVAGRVTVLYGRAPGGLSAVGAATIEQGSALHTHSDVGDALGGALTSGDLDGDGDDDLVIGLPGENTDSSAGDGAAGAGQLLVLRGGLGGLTTRGAHKLSQDASVPDTSERGDAFGFAFG